MSSNAPLTRQAKASIANKILTAEENIKQAPPGSPLKGPPLKQKMDEVIEEVANAPDDDSYQSLVTMQKIEQSITTIIKEAMAQNAQWLMKQESPAIDETAQSTPQEPATGSLDLAALKGLHKRTDTSNVVLTLTQGDGTKQHTTLGTYELLADAQTENVNPPSASVLKKANDYCIRTILDPTTHVTNIIKEVSKYITDPIYKKLWELAMQPTERYIEFALTEYASDNNQFILSTGQIRRLQSDLANLVKTLASVTGKPETNLQRILSKAPKVNATKKTSALNSPIHDVMAAFVDYSNLQKQGNARRADPIRRAELYSYTLDSHSNNHPKKECLLHEYLEDLQRVADGINIEGPGSDGKALVTDHGLWELAAAQIVGMQVRTSSSAYARELENLIKRVERVLDNNEHDNLTTTELYKVGTLEGLKGEAHAAHTTASHRDGKNNGTSNTRSTSSYTLALQTPVNNSKSHERERTRQSAKEPRAPRAHTGATALGQSQRDNPQNANKPRPKEPSLKGGPTTNPSGKPCNMCPYKHKDFRDCAIHMNNIREAGYTCPYLGQRRADNKFVCLVCGSEEHLTADCSMAATWGPFVGRRHPEAERRYQEYASNGIPTKPKHGAAARLTTRSRSSGRGSRRERVEPSDDEDDALSNLEEKSDEDYDDGSDASDDDEPHSGALAAIGGIASCLAGMSSDNSSKSK